MPLARCFAALTVFAAATVAAQTPPDAPPKATTSTGRIEGTVVISSALTARRPQFRIYSDPGPGSTPPAPQRDPLAAEVRNVVVYIDGDSSQFESVPSRAASRRATIVQRGERFVPHVAAITLGGSVDFPNEDDVFHNVFSLSSAAGARGFDLGRYPKGASRAWTFPRSGIAQVFCHIHQDMSATVLVLANPFFASPDESRRYAIDDVPEGEYTLVGWHERIKPITRRVRVIAGQTTVVDFNIPLPQGGQRP
jgi:plastocyanin